MLKYRFLGGIFNSSLKIKLMRIAIINCWSIKRYKCDYQGCSVDASTPEADEGRGVAAISLGEVPSNL